MQANMSSELILPEVYGDQHYQRDHPLQMIYECLNYSDLLDNLEAMSPPTVAAMYHLNRIQLSHITLSPAVLENVTTARCMSIFESNLFDIAAFILPKGYTLHLHDHPHMMVCTKLLAGSISIRSYSKVHDLPHTEQGFVAKLEFDQTKSSEDLAWYLTPKHGNFHEITALSDCVMLDLLLPPYRDEDRNCTFYHAHHTEAADGSLMWVLRPLPPFLQDAVELPRSLAYHGYVPRQIWSPATSTESSSKSERPSESQETFEEETAPKQFPYSSTKGMTLETAR